ncbi:MAG: DUF3341 domain-containing protein [Acidobacteriota bacterium]
MAIKTLDKPRIYGLMAEFLTPQELYDAVKASKEEGYDDLDAYMPYPVEDICHEVSNHKKSLVSRLVLVGGITGCTFGMLFQIWAMGGFGKEFQDLTYAAIGYSGYPFNIGGRAYASWPAFIPVAFELTILLGAFSAVFGMFALNRLPQPYHPVFNVPSFVRATDDRFFLVIESTDVNFDEDDTRKFLNGLGPVEVNDVDW